MNHEWARFLNGLHEGLPLPGFILESWQRCESFGLATGRKAAVPKVDDADRVARVARCAELIEAARPHLQWLSAAVAPLAFHCVMLTDGDGVIVDSSGNQPEVMDQFGLRAGHDWSERSMGTNGIGTALATRRPVAVVGDAHFLEVIHNYTCVGAPIVGADGRVLGAIDLCTTARDGDPSRLVLVAYAAKEIAEEIARRRETAGALKDRFAVVAHELGTPLTTLSFLSHKLVQASEPASPTRGLAQRFQTQLQRLNALLDGLLEVSTDRAGLRLPPPEVELEPLVREVAEDFTELSQRTGRPLLVEVAGTTAGRWDAGRWQQVTTNLVGNAYKYGLRGPVRVRLEGGDDTVRLSVEDEGPGIAPADRARIFERGVRGVNVSEEAGLGLGLWIVRDLVQSMGGGVALDDTCTTGARFVVTVPRRPAFHAEEDAAAERAR